MSRGGGGKHKSIQLLGATAQTCSSRLRRRRLERGGWPSCGYSVHLREALTKKKAAQRRSLWFPCPRRPCLGIPGTIGTRMRHLSTNSTQTGDSMLHCFFSRTPPPHKSASGARCSSSLLDHLPTHTLEPRKLRLGNVLRSARAKKVLHSSLVGSLSKRWAPRPQFQPRISGA